MCRRFEFHDPTRGRGLALRLNVIVASTRPGRIGIAVGEWFESFAREHGTFEPVLVDLERVGLPMYDEPRHPAMQKYEHEHTKRWGETVAAADAYAIVAAEYNHNPPPPLINALDFVYKEWNYKPVGIVSYGGVSGGLRSAQVVRAMAATLKMMPIPEGVPIPSASERVEDGVFASNELIDTSARSMLDELGRWAEALQPMRKAG